MNFLRAYDTDPAIAAGIIEYFHDHAEDHRAGVSCIDGEVIVDKNVKDSTDLGVEDLNDPRIVAWLGELTECAKKYEMEFPGNRVAATAWGISEIINIQYYRPGGGYRDWHTERINAHQCVYRHLVFMTFLNDIPRGCGGGTEFGHQRMVIDAKAGRTCIWPADWTYMHRGVVSPTHEKYIITGWFSYQQEGKVPTYGELLGGT
jgi:hypothetical protein